MVKKPGEFGSDEAADPNENYDEWAKQMRDVRRSLGEDGGDVDVNGRPYPNDDVWGSAMDDIRAEEAHRRKLEAIERAKQNAQKPAGTEEAPSEQNTSPVEVKPGDEDNENKPAESGDQGDKKASGNGDNNGNNWEQ